MPSKPKGTKKVNATVQSFNEASIEKQLVSLSGKVAILSNWEKDLPSARNALATLELYREQVNSIANAIPADKTTTNPKIARSYQTLRARLKDIRANVASNLEKSIEDKITLLEAAARRMEEDAARADAELAEVAELYAQLEKVADAYTSKDLKIVDHDRLHAEYKSSREVITARTHSAIRTDEIRKYIGKVAELNGKVNKQHFSFMPKIQAKLQEVAEAKAKEVTQMTVNEKIFVIAPPQVQTVLQQLIAEKKDEDLRGMLGLTDANAVSDKQSLVAVSAAQVLAITGQDGVITQEITALTKLSKEVQEDVAIALLTGKVGELVSMDKDGKLAGMSNSTQLVLTAALVNQLAIKAGVSKKDLVAVREFSSTLVTDMAQVERGEKTHFSVMVEVETADGAKHIAGFHIDLRYLAANTVKLSTVMAMELLKLGVKADTPVVTHFTSLPQVGALMQLQGRSASLIALHGGSLKALTESVVQDVSSLKQITNGEVTDVSDKALIAVMEQHQSSLVSVGVKTKAANVDAGIVFNVLSAMAVLKLTAEATVLNTASQKALGLTPAIGGKPMFLLDAPTVASPVLALGGVESPALITAAASVPTPPVEVDLHAEDAQAIRAQAKVLGEVLVAAQAELNAANKKPPVIDRDLVDTFTKAMAHLDRLHKGLESKYGQGKDIVITNKALIDKLEVACKTYELTGNKKQFEDESLNAVKEVKTQYNTHRDSAVRKFFGDIADAFSNLWDRLTLSKTKFEEKSALRANASAFFAAGANRLTHSAQVLHVFNLDIKEAFKGVGVVQPPIVDEGLSMGHGSH